jgi:archaellin
MELRMPILVVRGTDKDFTVRVTKGGNPIDLTNVSISCKVKDKPNGALLFTAIVTKTNPSQGTFKVRFPKTETQNLPPNRRVYFDFRFVFPDGTEKNYPTPPFQAIVVERVTD